MNADGAILMARRGRSFAIVLAGAVAAACFGDATLDARAAAPAATRTVIIDGVQYQPGSLLVHTGDTVVWVNKDPFPHTVTAKGAIDSPSIAAGASWRYVARKPGVYDYICTLHPNMKGTVEVE